jgi:hypothetical protein
MCIKCAKTHLRASVISKNFPRLYPRPPLKTEGPPRGEMGGKRKGKGRGKGEREEGGQDGRERSPRDV